MINIKRPPFALLVLLGLATVSIVVAAGDPPGSEALQKVLDERLSTDGAGGAMLVAREGKILFSRGYGLADREGKAAATPDTRFRIGSVTKQFTAAAILHLAEQGCLSIEDPLSKYFPSYPGGEKITLRQLLNHTSGLHSYTEQEGFAEKVGKPIKPADLIAWFQNAPPDFPPGEQFRYSNSGYFLLGEIVAKVSGQSFGDYLDHTFFGPLGMHDTGLWLNATPPANAAKGYSFDGKEFKPAPEWDMSWAGGAGELYSTTSDLWRWTEALQGGKVLDAGSLKAARSEFTVPKKETQVLRYGMGLFHTEIEWMPAIGHTGGLPGYLSSVMWLPDSQVTLVVLSNAMPPRPGSSPDELLALAARSFLQGEIAAHAPKVDAAILPAIYPSYAGRYQYPGGVQNITVEQGKIFAQLGEQPRFEILPCGPDAFFYPSVAARIVFEHDPKTHAVISLAHTQNGVTFKAPKLGDEPASVTLGNEVLDAFTGKYQYGPQAVLTVTRRENQLYAKLTGQPEFPIFPKSDHEFFWKAVPASVEFVRGGDGAVEKAIHHQGGATLNAPRQK
ncbi:serine hydrolase [Luteolibacter soli]|uniref:Serine hydrolase n=1 Tax=Luteolibacter soli TaxID=3135280 RepID=A0ABU9AYA5_9BACT